MSTRVLEDGTIVAGPLRPCEKHYGPHAYHGIDCATPAEWAAASAGLRERIMARDMLPASERPRAWRIWKSRRFKGQWVTRSPELAVHYHDSHPAAVEYVAAHTRQEVTA